MNLVHRLRTLFLLSLVLVAWASTSCSKGNPAAPTGPDGAVAAAFGDLTVIYERPLHRVRPEEPACGGDYQPRILNGSDWPGGYRLVVIENGRPANPQMERVDGHRFRYVVKAVPSGSNLVVGVVDGCIPTAPQYGFGLSINAVRLKDGEYWTRFDHRPGLNPSVVPR